MMDVVIFLITLPLAVQLWAALLAVRDGVRVSWALVRAFVFILLMTVLLAFLGADAAAAMLTAVISVPIAHGVTYLLLRWFFYGID